MASGFSQVLSCAAKGWVSRDFFVNLWYSFRAALNIEEKLSVEGPAVWLLADIGTERGNWEGGESRVRWAVWTALNGRPDFVIARYGERIHIKPDERQTVRGTSWALLARIGRPPNSVEVESA